MPERRVRVCHFLWALGAAGLPLAHYALLSRVEPFYTGVYSLLWWSFIFAVDGLVFALRRNSLLHDRLWEFFLLAVWSTPVWMAFEVLNFRLENWFYVMVPWELGWEFLLLAPAYATVLPGVFEVTELIVGVIERWWPGGRIIGRSFEVTCRNLRMQWLSGATMLVLPLLWPEEFFCLVWGFAFLLLDPLCFARGGRSLLGQLAAGDNTRLVALLASGFVCGGLWEAWNIAARTKWIYTVPFFDELKLFEMPLLGFLGFPPFVLECYAIVGAVSLLRGGRHWERSREDNARRRGMPRRRALLGAALTLLLVVAAALGIFRHTVVSASIPLDAFFGRWSQTALPAEAAEFLDAHGIRHTHQYLRLEEPPPGMPDGLHRRLRALSTMAEIKGMGLLHAATLEHLGIRTPAELAARSSPELSTRLNREYERLGWWWKSVRPAEVKVWIRAASQGTAVSGGRPHDPPSQIGR